MHNHSYENEFNLHTNELSFSYEWMSTKTRYKKEAQGNPEMAYSNKKTPPRPPAPPTTSTTTVTTTKVRSRTNARTKLANYCLIIFFYAFTPTAAFSDYNVTLAAGTSVGLGLSFTKVYKTAEGGMYVSA